MAFGALVASTARGESQPIFLEGRTIETSSGVQQAMVRLLKSSAHLPTVQRPTSRGTTPWVVQFDGAIREKWKTAVEAEGAVIHGYVPADALLVEASPEILARIASMDSVKWAAEYLPAYKKSVDAQDGWADDREYVVALFQADDKPRIAREFGEMNVFVSREELTADNEWFHVKLSPEQVDEVANWGEVEWIELDRKPQFWGATVPETAGAAVARDPVAALRQAFDAGVRIQPINQGCADAGNYGVAARAVDRFVWAHPEMLVVAAAGNAAVDLAPADGVVDAGSIGSPATAKNVLSVGAAEGRRDVARVWRDSWPEDFAVEPIALDPMAQADGPQGLAAFSGRGPCADGRIKPDLVAPGTFVVVPRPPDSDDVGWGAAENDGEIYVGGTGVAAEQTAAAARQVRQWLAAERGIAAPSAALVKALLILSSRDLAPGQYGSGADQEIPGYRPNNVQGFGLLQERFPMDGIEPYDEEGLATGQVKEYPLHVPAGGRVGAVLAYSDSPAALAAGTKLVNDLDLTVQSPGGRIMHADGKAGTDDLNNAEMIEFEAEKNGIHTIRIEARNVPMGGVQPFALAICHPIAEAGMPAETEEP